jgi:hypothetical protein
MSIPKMAQEYRSLLSRNIRPDLSTGFHTTVQPTRSGLTFIFTFRGPSVFGALIHKIGIEQSAPLKCR